MPRLEFQLDLPATQRPAPCSDLVGLDLGIQARRKKGLFDPKLVMQDWLVEEGRLGQKSGAGWYDYDENRRPSPSPAVAAMIEQISASKGVARRAIGETEIVHRLFFPLVNEGFKILMEGMAQRPADIDVCYVHGYNFPRPKGGPMFWADEVGLQTVKETLETIGVEPAALLNECVAAGMSLDKYWKKGLWQKANGGGYLAQPMPAAGAAKL